MGAVDYDRPRDYTEDHNQPQTSGGYVNSTTTFVGNLTRDPELRYTSSGAAVVNLGVAVNRRWQNRNTQEWEEQVSFIDVSAWSDLAENVAESLGKGDRVVVTGRLEQRSWESDSGETRSKVQVVADEVSPSLRWATVVVTRNEKEQRGGGRAPAKAQAPGFGFGDEEAF